MSWGVFLLSCCYSCSLGRSQHRRNCTPYSLLASRSQEGHPRHPRQRFRCRPSLCTAQAWPEEPEECVSPFLLHLLSSCSTPPSRMSVTNRHFPLPAPFLALSLPLSAVLNPKFAVCRPVLNQYVHTLEEFQSYSTELFKLIQKGDLKLSVHGEYPLTTEGIQQTQRDLSESLPLLHRLSDVRTGRHGALAVGCLAPASALSSAPLRKSGERATRGVQSY